MGIARRGWSTADGERGGEGGGESMGTWVAGEERRWGKEDGESGGWVSGIGEGIQGRGRVWRKRRREGVDLAHGLLARFALRVAFFPPRVM